MGPVYPFKCPLHVFFFITKSYNMCCIFTESHGNVFEEVKDYEVVRPVRLHTVRKRHAEVRCNRAMVMTLVMETDKIIFKNKFYTSIFCSTSDQTLLGMP